MFKNVFAQKNCVLNVSLPVCREHVCVSSVYIKARRFSFLVLLLFQKAGVHSVLVYMTEQKRYMLCVVHCTSCVSFVFNLTKFTHGYNSYIMH